MSKFGFIIAKYDNEFIKIVQCDKVDVDEVIDEVKVISLFNEFKK